MDSTREHRFFVFCYENDGSVREIYGCDAFADAWSYWFRWLDWNRVALCEVQLADGTLLFKSDVTQTAGETFEGQRIREIWVSAHPNDYGHYDDYETEIVPPA